MGLRKKGWIKQRQEAAGVVLPFPGTSSHAYICAPKWFGLLVHHEFWS
ncbi:MAG: hypothetical protein K2P87_02275 [Lachnospiraceae bacterium]|nr:hypothetical protein [Lachnospiraceae bacterium]